MKKISLMVLPFVMLIASIASATEVGSSAANTGFNTNVRVSPLSMLVGYINAEVDFGLGENFTLGPSLGYWSLSSGVLKLSATNIGVRGNYYLSGKRISDGWFLGPTLTYLSVSLKETILGVEYTASSSAFAIGAVFGYQWVWESGFNMNLAVGGGYYSTGSTTVLTSASGATKTENTPGISGTVPALEFTLGYAF